LAPALDLCLDGRLKNSPILEHRLKFSLLRTLPVENGTKSNKVSELRQARDDAGHTAETRIDYFIKMT